MDGDGNADLNFRIGRGDDVEYGYIKRCIKVYGFCNCTERSPTIKKENKGCRLVVNFRKIFRSEKATKHPYCFFFCMQ